MRLTTLACLWALLCVPGLTSAATLDDPQPEGYEVIEDGQQPDVTGTSDNTGDSAGTETDKQPTKGSGNPMDMVEPKAGDVKQPEDKQPGSEDTTPTPVAKKEPEKPLGDGFTVLGSGPIRQQDDIVQFALGYPEIEGFYRFALDRDMEAALGGGFFYGFNASTSGDFIGPKLSGEFKWRFHRDGEHSLSLAAAPAMYLSVNHSAELGLVLGAPQLLYDYTINSKHHAVIGAEAPVGVFFFDSGTSFRIPLVFIMGMDFEISSDLHAFVKCELGADLWTGDEFDTAYLFARAFAGMALRL